jgi:hypothetical protein
MTDISVITTQFQVENLSWDLSTKDNPGFALNGTLDVSAFTAASHYPNGYLPSGLILGRITATGLYAPYDNAFDADPATAGQQGDGREVAVGLLRASTKIPNPANTTVDVGAAILVAFAPVRISKLPIAAGTAGGGFLDAAAQADLNRLYFVA